MKGGEGEDAHRATFFACLQELLGEILRFLGKVAPCTASVGLDNNVDRAFTLLLSSSITAAMNCSALMPGFPSAS
jgi:hypothetical protein